MIRFGSVCSGIEAASVAWHPLGWRAAWFAEIEPFPSAVLAHHYPDVPNLRDMSALPARVLAGEVEAPELLCGGTPCQAFSVAGLRRSLDDARGNLSLTFCEQLTLSAFSEANPPPSFFGKTSQEFSVPATTLSGAFWEALPAKSCRFNRQGENGRTRVVCMAPREQSRGGPLMPNISVWPNDGAVCSLSQVLETGLIPKRFFLSSTACVGILRRAEKRGKELPPALFQALREASTRNAEGEN